MKIMILADKIMEERKRNGWSQEELAEKLNVSRQSVSKWEGAQSIPDINRILQMAELFGVSTDYLLKDDIDKEKETINLTESVETVTNLRHVSMEEASDFLKVQEKNAPLMAFAVSLCIISPILLIVLGGLSDSPLFGISENFAGGVGIVTLLVLVAVSVFLFIKCGNASQKFEYLNVAEIDTAYGVDGMAREKKEAFTKKFNRNISVGVILCILSCVPLLISCFLTEESYIITAMVGVLLLIIAIAVNRFVCVGVIKESYDKLLQEEDYTPGKKKASKITGKIASIYWLIAVAIYLGWSFYTMRWNFTWIVWPVAGVLFAAVSVIVNLVIKVED